MRHWYARAMSSYGMLQGLTGVRYDAVTQEMLIVIFYFVIPELLTNAICLLSGDHDGTLIVPCPPYR